MCDTSSVPLHRLTDCGAVLGNKATALAIDWPLMFLPAAHTSHRKAPAVPLHMTGQQPADDVLSGQRLQMSKSAASCMLT